MRKIIWAILCSGIFSTAMAAHNQNFDQQYQTWRSKQQSVQTQSSSASPQQAKGVSLNQASAIELQQQLTGIGEKKAQAIIEYRQQHGKFRQIDELKNIKGIGDKLFEKNRDKLRL
ncbi:ComEA family DNA-binding protein [Acinetobacter sp. MD2]|uniref:ComEA family DNA-binding protein n=1 Tax=Acinetobacter sp. MD2 TaxID=2600066 RepID=UPI002D1EF084|nr:ComEA family DNA-binding protein [Acinetobacter sp. MD2]MEB3767444.1 helix-hairpin-helix domain-containing protein [Acinetobacter sp. MD2]